MNFPDGYNLCMGMRRRYAAIFLFGILGLCLLAGFAYNLPLIHDRLAWRVDTLRVQVKRYFNPPEQFVFVPQAQVDAILREASDESELSSTKFLNRH